MRGAPSSSPREGGPPGRRSKPGERRRTRKHRAKNRAGFHVLLGVDAAPRSLNPVVTHMRYGHLALVPLFFACLAVLSNCGAYGPGFGRLGEAACPELGGNAG